MSAIFKSVHPAAADFIDSHYLTDSPFDIVGTFVDEEYGHIRYLIIWFKIDTSVGFVYEYRYK